ncbi:MAG: response regulator [Chloroflexi bacterium]|nr:response regulator [Chloroflexota bacterium]
MSHHILIADDEVMIRRLLTLILESDGYRVTAVVDGTQMIPAMEADKPDLVISDIMMPIMDGLAVLEELKEKPHLADVPVIIVTAAGSPAYVEEALALGAARCIFKPFAKAEILDVVHQFLPPTTPAL